MIELTPTAKLYPIWAPQGPSIWGWRTILCLLFVGALRWRNKKKEAVITPQFHEQTNNIMNKEVRLQQLLDINTSIRLPEQKAKALLSHLFLYVGIEHHEIDVHGYTLEEIKDMKGTEKLFPFFKQLYTIIYTDEKVTHSSINTITKSVHSLCSGN